MKKIIAILCAALMIFAALMMGFHHHEDGESHSDCSICIAVHYANAAISKLPQIPQNNYIFFSRSEISLLFLNLIPTLSNTRAPPV